MAGDGVDAKAAGQLHQDMAHWLAKADEGFDDSFWVFNSLQKGDGTYQGVNVDEVVDLLADKLRKDETLLEDLITKSKNDDLILKFKQLKHSGNLDDFDDFFEDEILDVLKSKMLPGGSLKEILDEVRDEIV